MGAISCRVRRLCGGNHEQHCHTVRFNTRLERIRQEECRIFFMRCPVKCLECGTFTMHLDLSMDHQHIACERCEKVWCAVCIARIDIEISPQWMERKSVAHLN